MLARRGWEPPRYADEVVEHYRVEVLPGQTAQVCTISGNRAITRLKANLELPAMPHDQDVLRELAIRIYCDGETTPSVWSPLGDFFGTAPGVNYYRTLPLGNRQVSGWNYGPSMTGSSPGT